MYAIVRTGGKQYRVEEGTVLRVERLPGGEGDEVRLEDVLLVSGEDGILIPGKEAPEALVTARVVRQLKGPKIIVFKYKPKKGYHRKQGHRQLLTELRIESISLKEEEGRPEGDVQKKGDVEDPPEGATETEAVAEDRDGE